MDSKKVLDLLTLGVRKSKMLRLHICSKEARILRASQGMLVR